MNTASIPALWIGMYVVSVVLIFRRHLLAAFIVALLACLVAVLESSFWSPLTWLTLAGIGIAGLPMVRDRIGGAVMLSLLLLIPALYTPYLRLWLPTEAFLTLFVAGGVATGANWLSLIGNRVRGRNWILTGAALALVAGLVNVTTVMRSERFRFWREAGWQPRTGYRETATAIQQSIAEPNKAYTMCRWPLNYYLFVAGVPIRPLAGEPWSSAIMSDYDRLLVDRAIQDTPAFQPTFERAKDRLRWETSELTDPDLPTLIDDFEWRSNFDVLLLPSEKQTVSFHEFARESPTNYRTWIFRK